MKCNNRTCDKISVCRKFCVKHYKRFLRHGNDTVVKITGRKMISNCKICHGDRIPYSPFCRKHYREKLRNYLVKWKARKLKSK